jgi:hypothetical protein
VVSLVLQDLYELQQIIFDFGVGQLIQLLYGVRTNVRIGISSVQKLQKISLEDKIFRKNLKRKITSRASTGEPFDHCLRSTCIS